MNSLIKKFLFPAPPLRWLIWGVYVAAWTAALLFPVPPLPEATGLHQPTIRFYFSKVVHISAYALFAVLTAWLYAPRHRLLLFSVLPAHAALTEFLQWLLPTGRTGCIQDVGIDLVGIGIGVALSWKWWRFGVTASPAPAASEAPAAAAPHPPASATTR